MTDDLACPKCSAPLPPDSPAGLCPKCLMAGGLATTAGPTVARGDLPALGDSFGPYRIGVKLGSGGMGAVYVAEHIESGRRLALKVLNHRLESPQHRQRFLREGRLAAAISHPNSVYIYGTDEIDGAPVIAMELAGGGTLQDRVGRDGPLGVGKAVDVILQIINGLEAAAAAGVLHRDIKPANCFFDTDGTVKVGDFGLSISTTPRADTLLTQTGIFLGTPAFSSPEQLRGDELDLRSDIYSVGVTLFYLLTGRMPFEGKQMVQLLATVLEQPAPSPCKLRPDVPAGLAKVVQQCMAKRSAQRYASYNDLRQALLPYATAAPSPATLGFRILAFGIDTLVLWMIAALVPILWARDLSTWNSHVDLLISAEPARAPGIMLLALLGILIQVGYFTLLEGWWGATAGKSICRLRVVGDRREAPGLWRAALRSCIFLMPFFLPYWFFFTIDVVRDTNLYDTLYPWLVFLSLAMQLALFVSARRANGYAAIHELASGTRVVRTRLHQHRPALEMADVPLPESSSQQSFGPYQVLGPVDSAASKPMILAYDTRLLRKVWIHPCAATTAPLPQFIRELARIGRLRWLSGQRSAAGGWDAYEAPSGRPLLELIQQKPAWDAVRFWLVDLAEELSAAQADGSRPGVLALDRVWITADGRAKLLDFPAPTLHTVSEASGQQSAVDSDATTPSRFLKQVAIAALEGKIIPAEQLASRDLLAPVPVSARATINRLGISADSQLPLAEFHSFTDEAATVSGAKRAGAFVACWIVPLALTAIGAMYYFAERQFLGAHPAVGELTGYIVFYNSLDEQDKLRGAVEIVVAHDFRGTVEDPQVWTNPGLNNLVDADGRQLVEGFVEAHPVVAGEELAAARQQLSSHAADIRALASHRYDEFYGEPLPVFLLSTILALLILFVVIPGMLSVVIVGNSLLLRALDIAIVNRHGATASRSRVLWRNTVLWTLVIGTMGVLILVAIYGHLRPPVILLFGWVVTMFLAERGLHDRLAGTWLVPR